MTTEQSFSSYRFGSNEMLLPEQMAQLARCFEKPSSAPDAPLGGRSAITVLPLSGNGRVVVKQYTRGGLVRFLSKHSYIKFKKTRGQKEYEILEKVRSIGVSVPEPVFYAYKNGFFYRAWLATREIPNAKTLAALSLENPARVENVLPSVLTQISTLIARQILHVDLHPGNVLISQTDKPFIIDFDKAKISRKCQLKLRNQYICRWERAAIKHRLPAKLCNAIRKVKG